MSVVSNFTLSQYEKMVEGGVFTGPQRRRLEFIRGEIRERNPIGLGHAFTLDRLTEWSVEHRPKADVMVRVQAPIRIPALESSPEPDIVWYARSASRESHPGPTDIRLVIEVAESSLAYDRGEKSRLYAEAGIGDYWVVDCAGRTVEVFRQPTPSGFETSQVYRENDEIHLLAFPDVVFTPAMIFSA